jgi:hypothetical protein
MLKKLLLTLTLAASFAFAGPCCKGGDANMTKACDTNATVAKCKLGKDCPCGAECKCGDNCKCKPMKKSKGGMACGDMNSTKCNQGKACDGNQTKKMKKSKKGCDGNMSGRGCDANKTK